ncbi:hypothetical protein ACO0QE_001432 [Hanseniaspora vineae]
MPLEAVSSRRCVLEGKLQPGTLIYDTITGKIAEVYAGEVLSDHDPRLQLVSSYTNYSPYLLLPGLVDTHVHLNEPGRTEWEGFETGTKAASSGGVTTVVDMPLNAIPPTTTIDNFNIKLKAAENQLWCDIAFWGGIIPGNLKHLKPLVRAGVRGFKGFLIESGVDEFPAVDKAYVEQVFEELQNEKTVVMFHAELQKEEHDQSNNNLNCLHSSGSSVSDDIGNSLSAVKSPVEQGLSLSRILSSSEPQCGEIHSLAHNLNHHDDDHISFESPLDLAKEQDTLLAEVNPREYNSFLMSRPDQFEKDALKLVISVMKKQLEKTGKTCLVHIVHLASEQCLSLLQKAQTKYNLPITAETCFHYLSIASENIPDGKTYFKCCPPIRKEQNRLALWGGLRENIITSVVSDHSPCTPNLKNLDKGDFFDSWGGIASVGLGLPLMYTFGSKSLNPPISFVEIVKWCCENTSIQVGLQDTKGFLRKSYDADFIVFDDTREYKIHNNATYFKNKLTAYDDFKVEGCVLQTFIRGSLVFDYTAGGHSKKPLGKMLLEPRTR